MTNKKTTLRALLLSLISVLACVALLVGSTFAWFTDSVSSMNNIIKSGNLDLVVEYKTDWSDTWAELDETTKLFSKENLYEPGYTEVVFLRVANAGSLALKYQLAANIIAEKSSTNVYGEEFKLSDHLMVGTYLMDEYNGEFNYADILFPAMFGTREAARANAQNGVKLSAFTGVALNDRPVLPGDKTSQVIALVVYMPEEVDNIANHKTGVAAPEITFGLNVLATQYTYEEDSFGPDYDEDAEYPVKVANKAEMQSAASVPGAAINGLGANLGAVNYVTYADGVSVSNATFEGSSLYGNGANGKVVFENVKFLATSSYAAHFDHGTDDSELVFINCEFEGWNSFGAAIKNVKFINCTFKNNGNYGVVRFYQGAVIDNCTFEAGFQRVDIHSGANADAVVTITNSPSLTKDLIFFNGAAPQGAAWIVDGVDITAEIAAK